MSTKTTKGDKKQEVKKAPPAKKPSAPVKTASAKPAAKQAPKPAPRKLSQAEKKSAETITEQAMRAFDAGATMPINVRIPTPVIPPASSTVNAIDGRRSIMDLVNVLRK